MILRKIVFGLLIIGYCLSFFQQEKSIQRQAEVLPIPLPAFAQKMAFGYLHQLGGIMHFIKAAVFIGGNFTNYPDEAYANGLSATLMTASELHPRFIDTYFLSESTLAYIGPQYARDTIEILKNGMAARPDNWVLPFFVSFNYNHYLNEPRQSADYLKMAVGIDGAPGWLEHLASVRAAEGGDILSGLLWLKAVYKGENDEAVRKRYEREIGDFEKALTVQKAILAYKEEYGDYPQDLTALIPQFLTSMPVFTAGFSLDWVPPHLKLSRER